MSEPEFAVLLCWRCDRETVSRFNSVEGALVCEACGSITAHEFEDEVMYRVMRQDGRWVRVEEDE